MLRFASRALKALICRFELVITVLSDFMLQMEEYFGNFKH